VLARFGWLRLIWADSAYQSPTLLRLLRALFPWRGLRLEIVRRLQGINGFLVQPKRWIVERAFAWLTHNRRLVRDYETREVNSEAMILRAASKLMLRRLAKPSF
jgi:putative transposase